MTLPRFAEEVIGWNTKPGNPLDDIRRALGLGPQRSDGDTQYEITQAVTKAMQRTGYPGWTLTWRSNEPCYPEVLLPNLTPQMRSRIIDELSRCGIPGLGIDLGDSIKFTRQTAAAVITGEPVVLERIIIAELSIPRKAPPEPIPDGLLDELGAQLDRMDLP
jgi:hypothetical protein